MDEVSGENPVRGIMLATESRTMVLGAVEAVFECTISEMSDVHRGVMQTHEKTVRVINLRR